MTEPKLYMNGYWHFSYGLEIQDSHHHKIYLRKWMKVF